MKQLTTKNKLKIINKLKIMCWSALILAFLFKILGVYYIDKGLNVDWLINLDNFVSKHRFIEELLNYCSCLFVATLMVLIVTNKKWLKTKELVMVISSTTLFYIIRCLMPQLSILADVFGTFVLPIILSKSKIDAYVKCWVMFVFINIFQMASLITRTNELEVLNDNYIYNLVMLIDYYIMFILYYLYSIENEKDVSKMGKAGFWWFGGELAHDSGYRKFKQVTSYIGMALTFPVSVPYVLCKRHQLKKKHLEN